MSTATKLKFSVEPLTYRGQAPQSGRFEDYTNAEAYAKAKTKNDRDGDMYGIFELKAYAEAPVTDVTVTKVS